MLNLQRFVGVLAVSLMATLPLAAQERGTEILAQLRIADTLSIIRDEGLEDADALARSMMDRTPDSHWDDAVARIYRHDRMVDIFEDGFVRALSDVDEARLDEISAFIDSELGQEAIALEIAAREALLQEGVEEIAAAHLEDLRDEDGDRLELLRRFVEVNDLIESNVVGGLNSTIAFQFGLRDTGALSRGLSDEDIVAMARSREEEIRADTREWVMSYLALAYQPLSDAQLETYTAFAESRPGQLLNRALFAAFDDMFTQLSHDLGQAAGRALAAQDL